MAGEGEQKEIPPVLPGKKTPPSITIGNVSADLLNWWTGFKSKFTSNAKAFEAVKDAVENRKSANTEASMPEDCELIKKTELAELRERADKGTIVSEKEVIIAKTEYEKMKQDAEKAPVEVPIKLKDNQAVITFDPKAIEFMRKVRPFAKRRENYLKFDPASPDDASFRDALVNKMIKKGILNDFEELFD